MQTLAKENGVKANLKNQDIIEQLSRSFQQSEGNVSKTTAGTATQDKLAKRCQAVVQRSLSYNPI
jgi:hypothetical protein